VVKGLEVKLWFCTLLANYHEVLFATGRNTRQDYIVNFVEDRIECLAGLIRLGLSLFDLLSHRLGLSN